MPEEHDMKTRIDTVLLLLNRRMMHVYDHEEGGSYDGITLNLRGPLDGSVNIGDMIPFDRGFVQVMYIRKPENDFLHTYGVKIYEEDKGICETVCETVAGLCKIMFS